LEDLVTFILSVRCMVPGSGPRCRSRKLKCRTNTYEPIGRWVKPACGSTAGGKQKGVKVAHMGGG